MKISSQKELEPILPVVTEDDIQEVQARFGFTFDQSRREILKSSESFDVLACPGSGKTTLLVAKLAVLAKKWRHDRRGICVLSHTNVAREEIERKLSGSLGERLLSYPHYVGTIHGFVNTFLALPLLRSEGRHVKIMDDDVCGRFCHKLLNSDAFPAVLSFLLRRRNSLRKIIRNLMYSGKDLALGLAGGKLPCGPKSASFAGLSEIKKVAAEAGLWRFDDMFAFAERLLEMYPAAIELVRWRFPVVFADEAQDTSEAQSRVLARVFSLEGCVLRQRFGDSNQAIYDHGQAQARTDPFPGYEVREVGNSQRFDNSIAMKAGPLAPRQQDLVGDGPSQVWRERRQSANRNYMPHTVFIFESGTVQKVLPAFGRLLLDSFSPEILRSEQFVARAIGRIGKAGDDEDHRPDQFPRSLSDYWPGYEPEEAKREPRPESLSDFIHLAQRQRSVMSDCAQAVSTAVKGISELLRRSPLRSSIKGVRGLNDLRELLKEHPQSLNALQQLLWQWCVDARPLCENEWKEQLLQLRKGLSPLLEDRKAEEATEFCKWSAIFADSPGSSRRRGLSNRYQFPEKEPMVEIDVGTIHSAKGQTHTATLVLETYFHGHDMEDLLAWLIGNNRGVEKQCGSRRLERMRLIYTAMTRPSYLLCLAMREQSLTKAWAKDSAIEAFQNRGWEVRCL